jgi:hypothetical protein
MLKTNDVRLLVKAVLPSLSQPYSEDVIQDVFEAIQQNPLWLAEYNRLRQLLGADVVNQWIGRYVKYETGFTKAVQVQATKSKLIESYSKLYP